MALRITLTLIMTVLAAAIAGRRVFWLSKLVRSGQPALGRTEGLNGRLRRQVIEVFPAGALAPVRIEHGEGRIVRISGYDPGSLEKTRELDEVALDLISEFGCSRAGVTDNGDSDPREGVEVHINHCTVFEFAPRADIVRDNKVDERAAKWMQQIADAREGRFGPPSRAFTPERFMDEGNWEDAIGRNGSTKLPAAIDGVVEAPLFINQVSPARSLRSYLLKQDELGRSVVFTAATERDLRTMDRRAGGESVRSTSWADATRPARTASESQQVRPSREREMHRRPTRRAQAGAWLIRPSPTESSGSGSR